MAPIMKAMSNSVAKAEPDRARDGDGADIARLCVDDLHRAGHPGARKNKTRRPLQVGGFANIVDVWR